MTADAFTGEELVTKRTDGESLVEIAKVEPLPLAATVRVVADVLEALLPLHDRGDAGPTFHREIAPRNVVVGKDGRAMVLPPLRVDGDGGDGDAPPDDVAGYLAPEVLLRDAADRRCDVYGAGVLLWEALMGKRMHAEGLPPDEIVVRLLGAKVDAPYAPSSAPWARGVATVARRALAVDPNGRFESAGAMLSELMLVASDRIASHAELASRVSRVAARRSKKPGTDALEWPNLDEAPVPPAEIPVAEVIDGAELVSVPPPAFPRAAPPPPPTRAAPPPPPPARPRPSAPNAPTPSAPMAIAPIAGTVSAPAAPPRVRSVETSSTDIAAMATVVAPELPSSSEGGKRRLAAIGVGALALLGIAVAFVTSRDHDTSDATPPAVTATSAPEATPTHAPATAPTPTDAPATPALPAPVPPPTASPEPPSTSAAAPTSAPAPPAPQSGAPPAQHPPKKKSSTYDPMGI